VQGLNKIAPVKSDRTLEKTHFQVINPYTGQNGAKNLPIFAVRREAGWQKPTPKNEPSPASHVGGATANEMMVPRWACAQISIGYDLSFLSSIGKYGRNPARIV
jgi:hypothetical protein